MEHLELIIEEIRLKERYKILSELWIPKSKHKIHLTISKEIDKVLERLNEIKTLLSYH